MYYFKNTPTQRRGGGSIVLIIMMYGVYNSSRWKYEKKLFGQVWGELKEAISTAIYFQRYSTIILVKSGCNANRHETISLLLGRRRRVRPNFEPS